MTSLSPGAFVTRAIHDFFRLREKKVIEVATSAVAAVLLDEGRNAHSTFKIPIPVTVDNTCSISERSQLAQDLIDTDFIIWDEIAKCHRYCVEAVDRSLRDITKRNQPFGGKCVLFSGDFRPNSAKSFPEARELRLCMLASSLQRCMQAFASCVLRRTCAFRLCETDPNATETALQFPNYLLRLGEGRLESAEDGMVELPESVQKVLDIDICAARYLVDSSSNYSCM